MGGSGLDDVRSVLLEALEREAPNHGVDIVDVEVVGSQKSPTVRVRIDHADEGADPITLDEVSDETSWISDLIDEADPIDGSYMLEVSSPGMARPLRKARDFERFAGKEVAVRLNVSEGRRRYTGRLEGIDEGVVRISCDEGEFSFPLEQIRSCAIKPTFDNSEINRNQRRKSVGKR